MILTGKAAELADFITQAEQFTGEKRLELDEKDQAIFFAIEHMYHIDESFKDYLNLAFSLYAGARTQSTRTFEHTLIAFARCVCEAIWLSEQEGNHE